MTKLKQPNGDDHPASAGNHLSDAQVLLSGGRLDGAAYLSGYVVECAIKTLLLYERAGSVGSKLPWANKQGHKLTDLHALASQVAISAGAKSARYFGRATSNLQNAQITAWTPEMRYRPAAMGLRDAQTWVLEADAIFQEAVAQMILDGVL